MTDFLALLRRDHLDLERGLNELVDPGLSLAELRATLDGVRLGLTAHAEAEDIVLYHALARGPAAPALEPLLAQARAGHAAQQAALSALVSAPPSTALWREHALALRDLVRDHAAYEERTVVPAIREFVPAVVYDRLAGAFATERLRQLALLQPSGPIHAPHVAQAS
jgi:hypothetical protein